MEASSIDPTSRRLDLRSQLLETTKPPAKVNESARIITVMDLRATSKDPGLARD
jgi:hypothetical protein